MGDTPIQPFRSEGLRISAAPETLGAGFQSLLGMDDEELPLPVDTAPPLVVLRESSAGPVHKLPPRPVPLAPAPVRETPGNAPIMELFEPPPTSLTQDGLSFTDSQHFQDVRTVAVALAGITAEGPLPEQTPFDGEAYSVPVRGQFQPLTFQRLADTVTVEMPGEGQSHGKVELWDGQTADVSRGVQVKHGQAHSVMTVRLPANTLDRVVAYGRDNLASEPPPPQPNAQQRDTWAHMQSLQSQFQDWKRSDGPERVPDAQAVAENARATLTAFQDYCSADQSQNAALTHAERKALAESHNAYSNNGFARALANMKTHVANSEQNLRSAQSRLARAEDGWQVARPWLEGSPPPLPSVKATTVDEARTQEYAANGAYASAECLASGDYRMLDLTPDQRHDIEAAQALRAQNGWKSQADLASDAVGKTGNRTLTMLHGLASQAVAARSHLDALIEERTRAMPPRSASPERPALAAVPYTDDNVPPGPWSQLLGDVARGIAQARQYAGPEAFDQHRRQEFPVQVDGQSGDLQVIRGSQSADVFFQQDGFPASDWHLYAAEQGTIALPDGSKAEVERRRDGQGHQLVHVTLDDRAAAAFTKWGEAKLASNPAPAPTPSDVEQWQQVKGAIEQPPGPEMAVPKSVEEAEAMLAGDKLSAARERTSLIQDYVQGGLRTNPAVSAQDRRLQLEAAATWKSIGNRYDRLPKALADHPNPILQALMDSRTEVNRLSGAEFVISSAKSKAQWAARDEEDARIAADKAQRLQAADPTGLLNVSTTHAPTADTISTHEQWAHALLQAGTPPPSLEEASMLGNRYVSAQQIFDGLSLFYTRAAKDEAAPAYQREAGQALLHLREQCHDDSEVAMCMARPVNAEVARQSGNPALELLEVVGAQTSRGHMYFRSDLPHPLALTPDAIAQREQQASALVQQARGGPIPVPPPQANPRSVKAVFNAVCDHYQEVGAKPEASLHDREAAYAIQTARQSMGYHSIDSSDDLAAFIRDNAAGVQQSDNSGVHLLYQLASQMQLAETSGNPFVGP